MSEDEGIISIMQNSFEDILFNVMMPEGGTTDMAIRLTLGKNENRLSGCAGKSSANSNTKNRVCFRRVIFNLVSNKRQSW